MYMGIDQYGGTFHNLIHPRKDLLSRLGATHADQIYIDNQHGNAHKVGYIIKGLWIRLFKVEPI